MLEGNFFYILKFLPILALTALLFGLLGWWLRCKLSKCGATLLELEAKRRRSSTLEADVKRAQMAAKNCETEFGAFKSKSPDSSILDAQVKEIAALKVALSREEANTRSALNDIADRKNQPLDTALQDRQAAEITELKLKLASSAPSVGSAAQGLLGGGLVTPVAGTKLADAGEILGKRVVQDDLKIVEGIGPKIEELLQAKNITTWRILAATDGSFLKTILDEAGERFRIHDPGTWPQQAALADAGKWAELRTLQNRLDGGKEPV
jgi:hypothetical protein